MTQGPLKKHPYILTILFATLLASIVWLFTPKQYTAITKIVDEYKEMDIAIGLSQIQAKIKDAIGNTNEGINDIESYCKILKSEDFVRLISHKQVAHKGLSYGEYLNETDTLEIIQEHINYNYSSKNGVLTISFTDDNALIAAQMLDSITIELQSIINSKRQFIVDAALKTAQKELNTAKIQYDQALKNYTRFVDSHMHKSTYEVQEQKKYYENKVTIAKNRYNETIKHYVRQLSLKSRSYVSFTTIQPSTVPNKTNAHFASYLLVSIIICLSLTTIYYEYTKKRKKGTLTLELGDFFSPWSLTLAVWTGELLLYFLQGTLNPIGPSFITNLALWVGTFIPASFLTFLLTRDDMLTRPIDRGKCIDVNMYLFYTLIVISLLFTILYAKRIYEIVSQFDTEDLLYNIRLYTVYKTDSPGILILTQGLNFSLFLTGIWLYPKISKLTITLIVAINLLLELSMMEKSGILIMILSALFVLYEKKSIKLHSIGFTLIGIIVFFFFFNLSKESKNQETTDFMEFLGIYVTSPIVAFEKLQITITDGWGVNTFNDVFPYLRHLGIHLQSIERLQDFVYVPVPTNVYTIMQPFYNDFGHTGVAIFGILYGWAAGYVYRKFYDGSYTYKCIYTFLVEVIIIQFYNENLLQQFHIVFETFFFVILLTATNHKSFTKVKTNEAVQRE